jgi:hypothetical protein
MVLHFTRKKVLNRSNVFFEDTVFFSLSLSHRSTVVMRLGILFEVLRTHSDTPYSVGLSGRVIVPLQRPLPDNATVTTYIHALGGIRTRSPSKQAAADQCVGPRDH